MVALAASAASGEEVAPVKQLEAERTRLYAERVKLRSRLSAIRGRLGKEADLAELRQTYDDAQAAHESSQTLLPTVLGGVNFALHSAGWLEGGLVSSYEKFIIDADQLGMMQVMLEGYDMTENGQAMDAIREVGPGSHYLGCAHTQANFQAAFFRSSVADNNSFEQWEAEGSLDTAQRANGIWKKMLADYEAPTLDPAIDEELQDFIAKKKASMPDAFS